MKHLQKTIDNKNIFLFDLDGTLVQTCAYHEKAYKKAREHLTIEGIINDRNYQKKLYKLKKNIYLNYINNEPIPVNQEVFKIYKKLLRDKKKVGVVSNTLKENIDVLISRFLIQPNIVISGSSFPGKIKPHPDMYQYAYKYFGDDLTSYLVFEDSEIGIKSALSAGMDVVDITTWKVIKANHEN